MIIKTHPMVHYRRWQHVWFREHCQYWICRNILFGFNKDIFCLFYIWIRFKFRVCEHSVLFQIKCIYSRQLIALFDFSEWSTFTCFIISRCLKYSLRLRGYKLFYFILHFQHSFLFLDSGKYEEIRLTIVHQLSKLCGSSNFNIK